MAIITSVTLGKVKPKTQVNWTGESYNPETHTYYGESKKAIDAENLRKGREKLAKTPITEERRSAMRAAMAYARSMRKSKKVKPLDTQGG